MKPGDHVMYMGRCAEVVYVFEITANIMFTRPVRSFPRQLDVYLSEIVIPGPDHEHV